MISRVTSFVRGHRVLVGAVVAGVLVLGVFGIVVVRHMLRTTSTAARTFKQPMPVSVVQVQQGQVTEVVGATGVVRPIDIVNVTSGVSARVEQVLVEYGHVVKEGQLLVQFERDVLATTVSAARERVDYTAADLARQTAELSRLRAIYTGGLSAAIVRTAEQVRDTAKADLARAAEELARLQKIYDGGLGTAMIKAAEQARDSAKAEVARSADKVRRIKTIVDDGLLPRADLDKAQAELDEARTKYAKAEQDLLEAHKKVPVELDKARADLNGAKSTYEQAEQDLIEARKNLPVEVQKVEAVVDKARADHGKAKESLASASQDLRRASVTSPVNGVVMERKVNRGELPKTGDALLVLGRIDQVLVETRIQEEKVGDVYVGEPATVTFNAFPNRLMQGRVLRIKPVTEQDTKTFIVDVQVGNADLALKPGLTAFARLERAKTATTIPSVSLVSPTGVRESHLFVVGDDSVARLRRVQVGVSGDGVTEIVGGLQRGESIVTVGQLFLRDGDRVRMGDEFDHLKKTAASPKATAGSKHTPR